MTTLLGNSVEEKEAVPLKVKLFTHNDLDGIGCAIVARKAFGNQNTSIEYCGYNDVDEKVKNFLLSNSYDNYDAVFITDISVCEEVAELINESFADRVQLIDHHATATWLNEYSWAQVNITEDLLPGLKDSRGELPSSGTSLFCRFLWESKLIEGDNDDLIDLVEQIRRYDTWDWHNVYGEVLPKQLNDLLTLIGRYKFVDRFVANSQAIFTSSESQLLEIENKRIDRYIKSRQKSIIEVEVDGYKVGAVYAEQYLSELGNVLATDNPQYDFIAMINFGSKSISLRGVRDDVHVGEFAKSYGGGGHAKAAGIPIRESYPQALVTQLLNNL